MSQESAHIVLVRHCETEWNAEHRVQGRTDIPLNEAGRDQACELSFALSKVKFHAIYSSHLKRAHLTAYIVAFHHNVEVITDEDLQEGYYGEAEGMTVPDYHARFEKERKEFDSLPYLEKLSAPIVPNAETRLDIYNRVAPALKRLAKNHLGERILVVTHGGVIRALLMALSEEFDPPPFIHNGAQIHLLSNGDDLQFQSIEQPDRAHPPAVLL